MPGFRWLSMKTISGLKEEITKILKDEIDSTFYKSQHVFNSDYEL